MSDFWDEMQHAFVVDSAIDTVLGQREMGDALSTSVRDLTDQERAKKGMSLEQTAGTRVRFVANLGSVLSYDDVPDDGLEGTVVSVKAANGVTTHQDGHLFVLWDDGKFRSIMPEHLRLARKSKKANNVRMVVSDFSDLSSFFASSPRGNSDELVHKSTKDLWSFRKDGDQYVIERLFDETGEPLKV